MITQDGDRRTKSTDPKKCTWLENYENDKLSGIEFRKGKTNKIVNFIAIQHDEILDNNSFRIAVKVDEDDTFTLPPKQTFEEMIQAKRRQQMLLYGPGNSASNSAVLSDRAARRVAAAARRQSALTAAINRQHNNATSSSEIPRRRPKPSVRARRKIVKKKPKPKSPANQNPTPNINPPPASTPALAANFKSIVNESFSNSADTSNLVPAAPNGKVVTSVKELYKQNPRLSEMVEAKKIKLLLKDAPPGAHIVMPDGTVLKKSRRGGARAGAGRKRSRPLPNGQIPSQQQQQQSQPSTSQPK